MHLLIAGTPCQSFSINGLRKGLDDDRGKLIFQFLRIVDRHCPQWVIWENVPNVLRIEEGRAFGSLIAGLGECGYGYAWRVLDAQYFGVPQRRRRVFVVGYRGDPSPPGCVLFDTQAAFQHGGAIRQVRSENTRRHRSPLFGWTGDPTPKFGKDVIPTLRAAQGGEGIGIACPSEGWARKLTLLEMERVQGFPSNYTAPFALQNWPAVARKKVLGNTFAIPVVRWIVQRIQCYEELKNGP